MASAAFGPILPGVSIPHPFAGKLPDILAAIEKVDENGEPREEKVRAEAIQKVADEWYRGNAWYYKEARACQAMDAGLHYGFEDEKTGLWVGNTLDEDSERVRITINCIKAVNDTAAAMLTQDAPIFKSSAGQPGVSAAAANETARAFLDHAWRFHNLDDRYRGTGRSAFSTGTSFVLPEWDKTRGPRQAVGYQGAPPPSAPPVATAGPGATPPVMPSAVGPGGELVPPPDAAAAVPPAPDAMPQPVMKPQGELSYRFPMRDQVAFDATSRVPGGKDGIGVFIKWRESRARLMQIAPDKFKDLAKSSESSATRSPREESTQRTSPIGGGAKDDESEMLDVLCLYLRDRDDAPRGNRIVVCDGKILEEGENDVYPTEEESARGELWPEENWPLYTFIADERENCPWGRSRTVDAIPIQHAINGCYSKAIQHIGIIANVKYILPSGLDWEPTDEPGQVARVATRFWQMTAGRPVQMTQPPQMPPEYLNTAVSLIERLEYATGVNAASMGNAPSSQPSGRLTENLQQRDNTRIAPMKRSHDNQWGKIQTYALRLYRKYATGGRWLRVVGPDQAVALKFFQVADLAAGTEIYVINDTSLPRDPAKRQMMLSNMTKDLAQMQTDELKTGYLEMMHVPEVNDWLQRRSPHQIKAIRNCRLLLLNESDGGAPPPGWPPNTPIPDPWDNALIHKAELERFATSSEWLERVKAERADPANMGQSPLQMRTVALWTYFTQHAMPQAPAGPPQPGQPPAGAPPEMAQQAA